MYTHEDPIPEDQFIDNNEYIDGCQNPSSSSQEDHSSEIKNDEYIVFLMNDNIFCGDKTSSLNFILELLTSGQDLSKISIYKQVKLAIDFLE